MKPRIKCLFLGCAWSKGLSYWSGGEKLLMQTCRRCGSCRTTAQ